MPRPNRDQTAERVTDETVLLRRSMLHRKNMMMCNDPFGDLMQDFEIPTYLVVRT